MLITPAIRGEAEDTMQARAQHARQGAQGFTQRLQ